MAFEIVEWRDTFADDFRTLTLEWLEKYVEVEEHDIETIENPRKIILDPGGMVWFALDGSRVVGTVSIIKENENWELAKLAVTEEYKGRGIGTLLMNTALSHARKSGIEKLVLFTNSSLTPAIHLYHKFGFRDVELTGKAYDTADTKMELYM